MGNDERTAEALRHVTATAMYTQFKHFRQWCRGIGGSTAATSANAGSAANTLASVATKLKDVMVFSVVFISVLGLAFAPLWDKTLNSTHVVLFAILLLMMTEK